MVTRAALVTILLLGAQVVATSLASAHVPEVCKPLFLEAGKATEGVVRKGNEANEVAMDGLDRGRRVDIDDYLTLADHLAQLLGWQIDMFIKLTEAITCVDKQH